MPLDAVCLQAVVEEIAPLVVGSRIEKIQQPSRDQVVLLLRGSRRLLLCASPNQPRLHLTEILRDNPSQPPMFCMLLRKYITGARIAAVEQPGMERMVTLVLDSKDELGDESRKRLTLELMGRSVNLVLVGSDGRILDCLRRADMETNSVRPLLPGLFYDDPPKETQPGFFELSRKR